MFFSPKKPHFQHTTLLKWGIITFLWVVIAGCQKEGRWQRELPIFQITTESEVRPEPKVSAELTVLSGDRKVLENNIEIEYRGSTSYRLSDKKSYGFTTVGPQGSPRDISILGLPEETDWILMGHVYRNTSPTETTIFDPSLMHHFLGYEWARDLGLYASRTKWVELEINGDYQGVYLLMEKLKASTWRIDVSQAEGEDGLSLTGGYILKIDKTSGSETSANQPISYYDNNWADDARYTPSNSFRSAYDIHGELLDIEPFGPPYHPDQYLETYFLYEHPAAGEMNYAQRTYIANYIRSFEDALAQGSPTYTNYIDLESFANFFILNELAGNVDAYRISTFLHKPRGGKLRMGPIWDLNIGFGRQGRVPQSDWIAHYNTYVSQDAWSVPFWWPALLEDEQFRQTTKSLWETYRLGPLSTEAVLAKVQETETLLTSTGAYVRNYGRWSPQQGEIDYLGAIDYLESYLRNRLAWMDAQIAQW